MASRKANATALIILDMVNLFDSFVKQNFQAA